eukprot:5310787-Prymnesium_polylepis.1
MQSTSNVEASKDATCVSVVCRAACRACRRGLPRPRGWACLRLEVNTLRETDGTRDNGRKHVCTQVRAARRPRGGVQ